MAQHALFESMSVIVNLPFCTSPRISDRIDSNDCRRAADLSENGSTQYPKLVRQLCSKNLLSGLSQSNLERWKEDTQTHRHDDTCGANQNGHLVFELFARHQEAILDRALA